jgi:hypothetical protein
VWPEFGLRLTRDFSFDATGDFVVKKTFDKVHGEARLHSLWSVVLVQPIVTFTAAKPRSPYRDGFHWILPTSQTNLVQRLSPSLLQVSPGDQQSFKIGVDAPVAALVAVKGKQSVRIRAARGSGVNILMVHWARDFQLNFMIRAATMRAGIMSSWNYCRRCVPLLWARAGAIPYAGVCIRYLPRTGKHPPCIEQSKDC